MPTRARTRALAAKAAVQEDEDVEVEEIASGEDMEMSDVGDSVAQDVDMSEDSDDDKKGKGKGADGEDGESEAGYQQTGKRGMKRTSSSAPSSEYWKKEVGSEDEGDEDENEDEVEEDGEEEGDDAEEELEDEDNENAEDAEVDELSPTPAKSRSTSPSQTPVQRTPKSAVKPRLKIMLKFNKISANTTPTPSEEAVPVRRSRKGVTREVSVESEDDDDEDETSTRSTSYAGPSRMTQRQAAMKGFVEKTDYLSLDEPASKRKKHLNETELALKREETARKRKNLSVKKLEDEKAETINRLLKKQSRPRGKKQTATTADVDEEIDPDGDESAAGAQAPALPTLFRWVSSSKPDAPALSFSVPASFLPEPTEGENGTPVAVLAASSKPLELKPTPLCDVKGCKLPRKYKLVKNPAMGGCGMDHLKSLQVQVQS